MIGEAATGVMRAAGVARKQMITDNQNNSCEPSEASGATPEVPA